MRPPPPHLRAGRAAEDAACALLEQRGYRILLRNWRARVGELDVVALDDEVLAVVEVRYRASTRCGGGAASIDARKRARIVRATRALLQADRSLARRRVRFDVVEVGGDAAGARLLRGAFSL